PPSAPAAPSRPEVSSPRRAVTRALKSARSSTSSARSSATVRPASATRRPSSAAAIERSRCHSRRSVATISPSAAIKPSCGPVKSIGGGHGFSRPIPPCALGIRLSLGRLLRLLRRRLLRRRFRLVLLLLPEIERHVLLLHADEIAAAHRRQLLLCARLVDRLDAATNCRVERV